mmetsp:Transcript_11480/g.27828  ORF Transcript_11480/g.27828 Transcript_11480/m.27828 type:complete len:237 (-) Transcript_11480:161-871(-)
MLPIAHRLAAFTTFPRISRPSSTASPHISSARTSPSRVHLPTTRLLTFASRRSSAKRSRHVVIALAVTPFAILPTTLPRILSTLDRLSASACHARKLPPTTILVPCPSAVPSATRIRLTLTIRSTHRDMACPSDACIHRPTSLRHTRSRRNLSVTKSFHTINTRPPVPCAHLEAIRRPTRASFSLLSAADALVATTSRQLAKTHPQIACIHIRELANTLLLSPRLYTTCSTHDEKA